MRLKMYRVIATAHYDQHSQYEVEFFTTENEAKKYIKKNKHLHDAIIDKMWVYVKKVEIDVMYRARYIMSEHGNKLVK